jgi:adenylate cyclase
LPAARDGAGNPIEVVGAWSDVTARKQLAEALAAAQERLVHLLTGSGAPMADRPSGRSHRN